MGDEGALVGLSDAVEALRAELTASLQKGATQGLQFGLEPIELTVQATVTKGVDGGFSWKIIKAGAKYENAQTQTLKLRLIPTWVTADGTKTTDFTIADVQRADGPTQKFGRDPSQE